MSRPRRGSTQCTTTDNLRSIACGFSIVELLVCIGVVAVLIGLMLPTLGASKRKAKIVGAQLTAHQCGLLIDMYLTDYRDVYPLASSGTPTAITPGEASRLWYQPLILAGYADSVAALDPDSIKAGKATYRMSIALAYDDALMIPGSTVAPWPQVVSPVRRHEVRYPDSKGAVYQFFVVGGDPQGFWCCLPVAPTGAVAMCDNSVRSGPWTAFVRESDPPVENAIGLPVYTTWAGRVGRDIWR
jgi:type II secretory pathway pseudopilin PulG